ncbi:polyamine-modulated factor 1-binding protein 1-like [Phymastichus coffea]|uniref:polyamine-modulated factor 1-binding protein 1-like n=1 Tax=Phymastichus coffea TaxID=108790 RepID=UPI00273BB0B1|nr:polyamine-modulated factor 1-binding protein 1-like [Phymastichus coffea]
MKDKINELEHENYRYQYQCINLERENQEAKIEVDKLRCDSEESRKESSTKQQQIDILLSENIDLKKQLNTYKLDFDLIEQEMKKMGVINSSIEKFRGVLSSMTSENIQYRLNQERYLKLIDDLKRGNKFLKCKLFESKLNKDNQSEKYKQKILQLQNEICIQQDKIKRLNTKLSCGENLIGKQIQVIENLKERLFYNEHHIENCCSDLHVSKETIYDLRAHIDSLKITLTDKFEYITKLKSDNLIMKNENKILKAELDYLKHELAQKKCQLNESQKKYDKLSQDLNQYLHNCEKRFAAVQQNLANETHSPSLEGIKSNDVEKKLASLEENLSSKTAALAEIQSKFNALTSKNESSERICQRQKDEIMLLEKKHQVLQQKFQNCTEKNEDLLRQNKLLEEHNNKCMAELEDIVLQLEDMQSSLVDLRTECDTKAQSLDAVSIELERMKASKSEVCEESKYVLEWVRVWMRQQRQSTTVLQNKLHDKQEQLLHLSIEKKNFTTAMRRLKRANKILIKRLKLIHKPISRQADTMLRIQSSDSEKAARYRFSHNSTRNKYAYENTTQKQSKAVCSCFKRKRSEAKYRTMDKIVTKGDYNWFPILEYLMKEIPQSSQVNENISIAKVVHYDMTDGGYQTSSSK